MKILDRYVLVSFLKNYVIALMVLLGLYVVLDMVFNFDQLVDVKGMSTEQGLAGAVQIIKGIVDYYFYQSFLIYAHLSGVIPVVAVAFTLIRLSRFNELSAILAAGVPLLRLSAPIIFASLGLNVLLFADQEALIPTMIPKLTRTHDQIQAGISAFSKGYPIQAMQDSDRSVLMSSRFSPESGTEPANMLDVDVIERDQQLEPIAHISADRADWDDRRKIWLLTNGKRVTGLLPEQTRSPEVAWPIWKTTNITPEEIALYRSNDYVELLSTDRINQLLGRPQNYGTVNLLTVKHSRVTQWLMNLVLVLLAVPCVLTREPGKLKQDLTRLMVIVGMAMGTIFICRQIAGHPPAGVLAASWPALLAWVPVFIYTPLSIYLLDRLHTRGS
jgi:lipopolysaccharide export system permease protein